MDLKKYLHRVWRYLIKGLPTVKVEVVESASRLALDGKTILITGGGSGLGYAIARRCLLEGAGVIIVGRDSDRLGAACASLASFGDSSNIAYLRGDVSSVQEMSNLFVRAQNRIDRPIDAFVSNAGVSLHEGGFRNVTEATWDAQFDTNLKGSFFLCKAFIEYLESNNREGAILVITSERARRPDDIPYGLTKVASDSFVRALACRVIKEGIRINGLAPGVTCSSMTGWQPDGDLCNDWQNNGRIFLPEEVAEIACFLLSDASKCISGEIIACNQGNHIACW